MALEERQIYYRQVNKKRFLIFMFLIERLALRCYNALSLRVPVNGWLTYRMQTTCLSSSTVDALCTCPSAFLHTDQSLQDPQPQLVVLNMSSWSDHSTFALHIVPDTMAEEQEKMSSYKGISRRIRISSCLSLKLCVETRFQDIWPLSDQTDPAFGYITSSAPVSSNHLAIGYSK